MITPELMAKSNTEHSHQTAIFIWANLNLSTYPDLKWLFAVPNGGARDKITGARLRAEGVKPGLPDIGLMVKRGSYQMLWIELKKPKLEVINKSMLIIKKIVPAGKVSVKQSEWLTQARECGHGAMVCYGWIEARDVIIQYLGYGK